MICPACENPEAWELSGATWWRCDRCGLEFQDSWGHDKAVAWLASVQHYEHDEDSCSRGCGTGCSREVARRKTEYGSLVPVASRKTIFDMTAGAFNEDVWSTERASRWVDTGRCDGWRHEVERVIWRVRFAEAAYTETWSIKLKNFILREGEVGFREEYTQRRREHHAAHLAACRRLDEAKADYARVMDPLNVCRLLDEALDRR